MSFDLTVTLERDGEAVDSVDMNWLRNPFGLERWASANVAYATKREPPEGESLWYVCNHWAYGESDGVDRALFRRVVDEHWAVIQTLERGRFWFDAPGMWQFVVPHLDRFPRRTDWMWPSNPPIDGAVAYDRMLGIPQEHFGSSVFHLAPRHTLERYKTWFAELVRAAELLQDPAATFYASN